MVVKSNKTKINVEVPIETLQKNILQQFKQYKWDKPDSKNGCEDSKGNSKFELSNTQEFVSDYLTPDNPNGLLLWHSVGSGKTLSAVAIARKFEDAGFNTLWVTRTTLKGDLQKATTMLPLSGRLVVLSYKQFSNVGKKKGEIYRKLVARAKKKNATTNDPLYKTIVIIDEVHKLYTKDLKAQEMHDIGSIERMIHESYKDNRENACKVVLMSATPITSNPMEIIHLFNLIIEAPINRFDIESFKKDYLDDKGKFTEDGRDKFQDTIKDLVSYIDMSKDPRKFAQVKYTEILVPISAPESDVTDCKGVYTDCRSHLGLSVEECREVRDKCKEQLKINKRGKYQTKILSEKCGFDLNQ